MDTSSIDLPNEIIELVLSSCPAKSVVRFKSVSKSWQSIISDPRFSRIHRIQRAKLSENQNKFFLLKRVYGCYHHLNLMRFEDGKVLTELLVLGYPFGKSVAPLSSFDGLILLGMISLDDNEFMLWNPFIRKHIIIPNFSLDTHLDRRLWSHLYHDSITDDYKIVKFYRRFYTVYSCNNGSWGEIKDFPCDWNPCYRRESSAVVDGCLYVRNEDGEIMYFDARDGKMHKLPQPKEVECLVEVQLKAVSGRMCLYGFLDIEETNLHLWVMEENGSFDKSWRKLISMAIEKPNIWGRIPVCLSNEDEVILLSFVTSDKNFLYNPRSDCSFKEIYFPLDCHADFFPYTENLYIPSSNIC